MPLKTFQVTWPFRPADDQDVVRAERYTVSPLGTLRFHVDDRVVHTFESGSWKEVKELTTIS